MADLSKPGKHATICEGPHLTQDEDRHDCDANVIIRRLSQGIMPVQRAVRYGSEDMNLDRLHHEIQRAHVNQELKMNFDQLRKEIGQPNLSFEEFMKSPKDYIKGLDASLKKKREQPPAGSTSDEAGAESSKSTVENGVKPKS